MSDYRIVLADDHAMMRAGIRQIIETKEGLQVVAEVGDGLELLRLLNKIETDMVILDLSLPGMRGIEAAHEIRSRHPRIVVLVLSMHKSREYLGMAMAAGARGYLLKEETSDELLLTIERVRQGRTYVSPKLFDEFQQDLIGICSGDFREMTDPLTQREKQILHLIAEGNTDRQIGERLHISTRTAQRHHYNIRTKLNLKSTADLVKYALNKGHGDPDSM